jgi:hypothetical protein
MFDLQRKKSKISEENADTANILFVNRLTG